jgi:hypothetical protein
MERIQNLIDKYEEKREELEEIIGEDKTMLQVAESGSKNAQWLADDILSTTTQISIYECIIKDLKELLK